MRSGLVFAVAALSLGLGAAAPAKLRPGAIAPDFARADIHGQPIRLSALRGRLVLIDFWASWCAPCIVAIPHLIDLQKRYGPRGLQVIGVSMDDGAAPVKEVAAHYPFNYPIILGDAKFGLLYGGILGLPVEMLVGRDGRIVAIWRDDVSPAMLEKAIQSALVK